MKKFLFLLTGLMCMLVSCGGGEDSPNEPTPTPNPTPNEPAASITMNTNIPSGGLAFDVKGGEKSVDFTTNKDWTVTVAATTGGATWCTASPTSGKQGDATVKFTVKENTDYDDRSVSVTIKAGTASKTFTINQKGAEALLVTTTKYEVEQAGGEIEVEVQANIDYEMEISETAKSWISEATTRALTTHKHTFTIAANEEVEKREGEIVFKSGDKVETVKVYQAGGAVLVLSQNEFNVSDAGEVITIDVKSNIDFGVQMPNADWISNEAATRGMSSHTLKYDIAPNETYDAREAEIVFYDKNSDLKETVKIVQVQKDAIIISNKSYEVKAEGETIEVKLSANVEFDVTMPDVDWISQVTTRGLTEHTLYYKVAENTNEDSRSAEIVFTNKESQLSEKIVVTQQQKSVLSLDKNEYSVSAAGETISIQVKSNVTYEIQMPDVDWITKETSTRAASTETVKFVIAPNETYDGREAEILFKDKNSNLSTTLKITQAQKDAIILSQKEISVKAEGETIEVKLSANVEFDVTMPDMDWISQVSTRGLTEHSLYFEVAKNVGEEKRNAEIVFKDKNSQLSDKLTISQFGSLKEGYENGVVTVATAGTMKKLIGDDYLNITSLKIIGFINGDDVYHLRRMLGATSYDKEQWGKLSTLDLSEAAIVEGGGYYYYMPTYYTSDNVIGEYMFEDCDNLQSIKLPEFATSIGKSAFSGCDALTSITIPNGVTSIGRSAFFGCDALTSITIPENVTSIEASAFSGCVALTSITIPENVTSIEESTFYGCKALTSITIPENVTSIGGFAFSGCVALTSITIPNSVTSIGKGTFRDCNTLTSVTIGNSVTSIGESAFSGCVALTSITIPENVTSIEESTFYGCKALTSITIPENVTSIGNSAFSNCVALPSITIPENVTSIGNYSFEYCYSLTSIIIPNNVTSIGEYAFYYCKELTSITIGDGVKEIPYYLCYKCTKLSEVIIGKNVKTLFGGCFCLGKDTYIDKFYCYASNPPELVYDWSNDFRYYPFVYSYDNTWHTDRIRVQTKIKTLYVPLRSGTRYSESRQWEGNYLNIIEMEE